MNYDLSRKQEASIKQTTIYDQRNYDQKFQ